MELQDAISSNRPGTEQRIFWRTCMAGRARVLFDGAEYFGALRQALLRAQRSVFIVGWDIHSRTRLLGESGAVSDGWPEHLGPFLQTLAAERSDLAIRILVWKSAFLYAGEREWQPAQYFTGPPNLFFCLDDCLPLGSAQHQKLVVIDDRLAFSGGLDLTIRRWDTASHEISTDRYDPDGRAYAPFHDVQIVVDGAAATALGELARNRWRCAGCDEIATMAVDGPDPWPDDLVPHFTDIEIGIARTEPRTAAGPQVEEVKHSLMAALSRAQQAIYIENQFLSSIDIATCIAERLRARPALEVLLLAPQQHESWIEARTMRNGRLEFMKVFVDRGVDDRVRLVHPSVEQDGVSQAVMVHSKVMIIDDWMLRVGSANLNNRSMGADTECDLVIEARTDAERQTILAIRDRLIGHFCGVDASTVRAQCAGGSLFDALTLANNGHSLRPIRDGVPDPEIITSVVKPIADPARPLELERSVGAVTPRRRGLALLALAVAAIALAIGWNFTPLHAYAEPDAIRQALQQWSGWAAPLIAIVAFLVGGLLVFPVILLIAATAAAFGPILGFVSALCGVLASASLLFAIGRLLGRDAVERLAGRRIGRLQNKIVGNGLIAVALVRMTPIAPFSLVNIMAGAIRIRFLDYILGTLLGMAPGLVAMSALGSTIAELLRQPDSANVVLLAASIAFWLFISFGAQLAVVKLTGRRS